MTISRKELVQRGNATRNGVGELLDLEDDTGLQEGSFGSNMQGSWPIRQVLSKITIMYFTEEHPL